MFHSGSPALLRFVVPILLTATVIAADSPSHSPKLIKFGSPQPVVLAGYDKAHCISLPGQIRIYKCVSETEDGTFIVERNGKRLGKWPASAFMGDTSEFEVLIGDLDGEGSRELVVANFNAASCGLGIQYWTISIFPDPEFQTFHAPLTFVVEDYHTFGSFVSEASGVDILQTRWLYSEDPKQQRVTGMYLVGQWWRYKSGGLVPIQSRQLIGRRLLESFECEMGKTSGNAQEPYIWLSSPKADVFKADPLIRSKKNSVIGGEIQKVSLDPPTNSWRTVKIIFRPDGGKPATYVYPEDVIEKTSLQCIGDAATGRIYPGEYMPSEPREWLSGRRAVLTTYGDSPQGSNLKVLWVGPKSQ